MATEVRFEHDIQETNVQESERLSAIDIDDKISDT